MLNIFFNGMEVSKHEKSTTHSLLNYRLNSSFNP